jgi:hypothetical protein
LGRANAAIPVALGKELEEEGRIINISKGWISAKSLTEGEPDGPGAVMCVGIQRNDSGIKGLPLQAKISGDFVIEVRWHKRQGSGCG